MSQVISELLSAVEPRGLRAYLRTNGWTKIGVFGDKGDVYEQTGVTSEIVAPVSSDLGDYGTRILQIADILGDAETRDPLTVLRDISLAAVDLIRVKAHSTEDQSVPLDAGLTLVRMAREALLAAACAADRPQRAYRSGSNRKATDYLKRVRLGHTEGGSYVITLLSPVPPLLDAPQAVVFPDFAPDPYPRQVTRMFARGVVATREALDLADRDEGIGAFDDRVSAGVSANLCNAIAQLLSDRERVGIGVSWALTRPSPERKRTVIFRRREGPVLAEASRVLRDRQDRPGERISGYVRALRRESDAHQGRVTVKAVVDGALTSVQVEFPPRDYTRIVEAHDNRWDITLDGDLIRVGQRWHLENPRNLYVGREEDE